MYIVCKKSNYITLGQFARILGVSQAAVAYWDDTGKLRAFDRTPNGGRRYYVKEQIEEGRRLAKESEDRKMRNIMIQNGYIEKKKTYRKRVDSI
jgi:predicted site-specific integrase-resolvase